ncbi:putative Acyl CoA binding protein [Leishmania naiffi]|uniref:Acyl CoA binding protein n=1 Tax=Leishmania naiffi TaxID=5678 RepID=A0AAW3B3H9_9TRYP
MVLPFPEKYYEVARYFDYYIGNLEETPLLSDEQRLLFYALRQQADHGQCTTAAPSLWYARERYKHRAWKQLGCMSPFEAMVFFVQQFEQLLMQLESQTESSVSTAGASPRADGVDWPSRLQEMKANTVPNSGDPGHRSCPLECDGARASNGAVAVSQGPSPPPPNEEAQQGSFPLALSSAEMAGWDADIVSHSRPTLENIRYLAAELMRARHAFQGMRQEIAPRHVEENGARASLNGPPIPTGGSCLPLAGASLAAAGPPLKPIWCGNGSATHVPIVPPPVRPSARSMTEAAVRDACGGPNLKKVPVATGRSGTTSASPAWFDWHLWGSMA